MKAVTFSTFGGPEVLEIGDLPTPEPGPGTIRIRVRAAGVNPVDAVRRSGVLQAQMADTPAPYGLGMDVAGTVDSVGDDTAGTPGHGEAVIAVIAPVGSNGAYSEYCIAPAESVAAMPTSLSFAEAATLPMNGITALAALDALALSPADHVAVTGGAGLLGGIAIQLAKARGLHVIAVAAEADSDLVHGLGADALVPRGPGFVAGIRQICPGGVDGLIDTARLDHAALAAVKDGGSFATFDGLHVADSAISVHQIWVRNHVRDHGLLTQVAEAVTAGRLTARVAKAMQSTEAVHAHQLIESGGLRGRIVLEF